MLRLFLCGYAIILQSFDEFASTPSRPKVTQEDMRDIPERTIDEHNTNTRGMSKHMERYRKMASFKNLMLKREEK